MRMVSKAPGGLRNVGVVVAAGLVLVAAGAMASAERTAQVTSTGSGAVRVVSGSRLALDGDSTLHKFSASATRLAVSLNVDGEGDVQSLVRSGALKGIVVNVPVASLASHDKGLDENMAKALKGKQHPTITFRVDSYDVLPAGQKDAAFGLALKGRLSIGGVEKPVVVKAQAVPSGEGLRVVGSYDLLMTTFGIDPPVMMMGMVKTRNEITVRFDLSLQPGQPTQAAR